MTHVLSVLLMTHALSIDVHVCCLLSRVLNVPHAVFRRTNQQLRGIKHALFHRNLSTRRKRQLRNESAFVSACLPVYVQAHELNAAFVAKLGLWADAVENGRWALFLHLKRALQVPL